MEKEGTRKTKKEEGELKKKWAEVTRIMEETKDSKDEILIVPLKDWNPTVLSPKRKELLITIKKKLPESETELAKYVHRRRENVLNDLKLLAHYGLVSLKRNKNKVKPIVRPYRIQLVL
jgi:predicted transcriptional regulator